MKAQSNDKPQPYIIERCEDRTDLVLNENTKEVRNEDGSISYEYDTYRMEIVYRDGIEQSISENFTEWVEFAKAKEQPVPPTPTEQDRIDALESAVLELIMGGA